jgi:hypothetical protein
MSGTTPEPATVGDQYDPIRLQPSPWDFYARARREEAVFYAPTTSVRCWVLWIPSRWPACCG